MADYATLTDVNALIPTLTFSDTTEPTITQAGSVITAVCAELDGLLITNGWSLPVSDANMLAFLKTACCFGSAAALLRARFPVSDGVGGDGGAAVYWESKYKNMRYMLASDGFNQATFVAETDPFGTGFPATDENGDAIEPWATRDTYF